MRQVAASRPAETTIQKETDVKKAIGTVLLGAVFFAPLLADAGTAEAASIRECGDMPHRASYNLTTRKIGCGEARRTLRAWQNGPARYIRSGDGWVRGLWCNHTTIGWESGDIRCTGRRGVVHWQTGV
jgi:hypothetical protein